MTQTILAIAVSILVAVAVRLVMLIPGSAGEKLSIARLHLFTADQWGEVSPPATVTTLSQLIKPARMLSRYFPVSALIGYLDKSRFSTVPKQQLMAAGLANAVTVVDFFAIKLLLGLIVSLLSINIIINNGAVGIIALVCLISAGYMLPNFFLSGSVEERQSKIRKQLPDAIDLLVVGMEAGLGFDRAMRLYCERFSGPLSVEFKIAIAEIDLGQTRRVAFSSLAERVQLEDLRLFVAAVLQAERLGTPLSGVLKIQSDLARTRHRQWIQELSAKAPVKILFPLAGLVLPALFAVLIGPIIIKMMIGN